MKSIPNFNDIYWNIVDKFSGDGSELSQVFLAVTSTITPYLAGYYRGLGYASEDMIPELSNLGISGLLLNEADSGKKRLNIGLLAGISSAAFYALGMSHGAVDKDFINYF